MANSIWDWDTNYNNSENSTRRDSIYSQRIGNGTLIDIPKRDPEPEGLIQLRSTLGDKVLSGLNAFNSNSWEEAQQIASNALNAQQNILGQLPNALNRSNDLVDELTNIARTGNIPSGITKAMNASVNQGLQSSMGSMLNNLSKRGVLNSSVTTAGTNQLSQAAADAYNKNYMAAYQAVLSGLGQGLQGTQNNTASLLSALGSIGKVPSQVYEGIGSQLTPAFNLWEKMQNFYLNDDPYQTIYAQDPADSGGDSGCVTGDTLITLEDGREIPIAELTPNDRIKTWDFNTGNLTSAPLTALYKNTVDEGADIIRLEFEDGSNVGVIYEHLFFDLTEGKFIAINSDNQEFVGHEFAKVNPEGNVIPVKVGRIFKDGKAHETFAAQGSGYLNFLTAGFISGNDGQLGLCNKFEFDTEKMTFDASKKAEDLEKYGLFDYEHFKNVVSKEFFDNNHCEEFAVAFGKGLIDAHHFKAYLKKFASSILE